MAHEIREAWHEGKVRTGFRVPVKVVLSGQRVLRFCGFTYVRDPLPDRTRPCFRTRGATCRACTAGTGRGATGAAGAGSHPLRRLGKERTLHRLLIPPGRREPAQAI